MSFGQPRRHFPVCGSTNDVARLWAMDSNNPAPHGALVTAAFQTQGRGRRGRRWQASAEQSALMSFVVHSEAGLSEIRQLGFRTALAVSDMLLASGLQAQLKWPNDILLSRAKAAGILVETALPTAARRYWIAVIGIGINVNQTNFAIIEEAIYPPTSLRLISGHEYEVESVIQGAAAALMQRLAEPWPLILEGWSGRLAVGASLSRGTEAGKLVGLNPDGSARVQYPNGTFADWRSVEGEEPVNGV